jgi:hypothetical protein
MSKDRRYFLIAGIVLLALVILALAALPDFILTPAVTVIGGDPYKATTDQVSVTTRTDFNSAEQMAAFPMQIDQWRGTEFDNTKYISMLKADTVLMRGYSMKGYSHMLFLIVVQANTDSAIHEPHRCFDNIQEQGEEELLINNTDWIHGKSNIILPLNKLVNIQLSKDGTLAERRVVLYFYVKSNQFYSDTLALVEVQGIAPRQGPYDETLKIEKEFLSQVVPLMFQPSVQTESQPLIRSLAERGISGYLIVALMCLAPLGLIIYSLIRRRRVSL